MVTSLLDLPDEALRLILQALGSDAFEMPSEARSLAICCRRLDSIYRASARTLRLAKSASASDCARLWDRFPLLVVLDLNFDRIPDLMWRDFPSSGRYRRVNIWPWCGRPGAFPNGLVRNGLKSIRLSSGEMHVRELQEMLDNATGLEELSLIDFTLYLGLQHDEYSDETCTFSLERHGGSLKKLELSGVGIKPFPWALDERVPQWYEYQGPDFDLRWLQLSSMSALEHLEFSLFAPRGYEICELATLPGLQYLDLYDMKIEDEFVEDIIPSLPRLRSVKFAYCRNLGPRVLQFLPSHLTLLDVSSTHILSQDESLGLESSPHSLWTRNGTRSVSTLVAEELDDIGFDFFMHLFDGASIAHLSLDGSNCLEDGALVNLLSNAPCLLTLSVAGQYGLNDGMLSPISRMASLRELCLRSTDITDDYLALLASGLCQKSLRLIDLRRCRGLEDKTGARRFLSERFASCNILL